MEGFNYVIEKQKPQKVCFGSGCPRYVLGDKGLSAYMRYHTLETYPNIAPWTYDPLKSFKLINEKPNIKSLSTKGYSGLAKKGKDIAPRNNYPPPGAYTADFTCIKKQDSNYPLNSTVKRSTFKININPGPGTYSEWRNRGLSFKHTFGGRVQLNLAVDLKCVDINTDVCLSCNKQPIGDYWHRNNKEFLCDNCMALKRKVKTDPERYLSQFRRIRDCSGIHFHDGTEARMWLIDPKIVAKCMRKEAYLSVYLKD